VVIKYPYPSPPFTTIHGILPIQSTCFTVFFHNHYNHYYYYYILDSLSGNELKAVECVVGTALVSEADAFDQHRKAVVVIEVAATKLLI